MTTAHTLVTIPAWLNMGPPLGTIATLDKFGGRHLLTWAEGGGDRMVEVDAQTAATLERDHLWQAPARGRCRTAKERDSHTEALGAERFAGRAEE